MLWRMFMLLGEWFLEAFESDCMAWVLFLGRVLLTNMTELLHLRLLALSISVRVPHNGGRGRLF